MKRIFLLGGQDLEMQEIRRLLEKRGEQFEDRKLGWDNALLSAYSDIVGTDPQVEYVGIELREDIPLPPHYIRIDHHNDFSDRPAAILQVAELLGIEPDRRMRLVAANDSGYIPAMLAVGATEVDINDIRTGDRRAQGLTEEDEKLCDKALEKVESKGDIRVVKSPIDKFSYITDKLYPCSKLLVYTDDQLCYYGPGIDRLKAVFADALACGKAYYGGGENGFFGLAKGCYSQLGIENAINLIVQKVSVYSHHIFMFPFITDGVAENDCAAKNGWRRVSEKDKIIDDKESESYYNEKNYFYNFVWPALYDSGNPDTVVRHYEYDIPVDKAYYAFSIKDKNRFKLYCLKIKYINLNLYNNNVGVLSFYLDNCDYPDHDDVLKINQFGRRIYLPYAADRNNHFETATKFNVLGIPYSYPFEHNKPNSPIGFIKELISGVIGSTPFKPIIDDRMFVLSWYRNDLFATQFSSSAAAYNSFKNSEFWYKYVFVDGGDLTCQNNEMQHRLIDDATYPRWQKWCTLYGISRYSMVMLTNFGCPLYLLDYFVTEYVRMAELLLVQRASILNFSMRIKQSVSSLEDNYEKLHSDYIMFLNQIHFREVTAQEQGIELYQMLYKKMDIGRQVKEMDNEIEELHNIVENRRSRQLNKGGFWVAIIAMFVAVTSLVNDIPIGKACDKWDTFLIVDSIILVIAVTVAIFFNRRMKKH